MSNYRDIDKYYCRGVEFFPKIMDRYGHLIRRIVTVFAGDDGSSVDAEGVAQEILGSVINDKNVPSDFVLYITADVYSKLDWQDRDNYQSPVDIAGIKAHKRYSDDSRDCFVVSPIGTPESRTRKRADLVFERFIKPACEATEFSRETKRYEGVGTDFSGDVQGVGDGTTGRGLPWRSAMECQCDD